MYPSYNEHQKNTLKMHLFGVPTLKKKFNETHSLGLYKVCQVLNTILGSFV